MFATYLNSLHESVSRRVALVLLGVAILVGVGSNALVHVRTLPDGAKTIAVGAQSPAPAAIAVPAALESILHASGSFWILLAIFAAAPLLTAILERGWLELTFAKGTARWRIFLGRFLAGLTLYALMFAMATLPVALRLWWSTGIPTWQLGVALLVQTFSFAALLAASALATLPQRGVALPVIAAAAIWLLTPSLAMRQQTFYRILSSHLARGIIDGAYRILPKCSELEDLCISFVQQGTIQSWWPVWSTAVFTVLALGLTLWLLERKSF
jgi:ABC-type transport system involved in multi-copper enzyme maturation permease subunit